MLNLEEFVDRCRTFASGHALVHSFSHGPVKDMATDKSVLYPTMHLSYMSTDYSEGAKTYSFDVYVLDVPDQNTNPDHTVAILSRAEGILEDLLSDIERGHVAFAAPHTEFEVQSASMQMIIETATNAACGMVLSLQVAVPFTYDACLTPIS